MDEQTMYVVARNTAEAQKTLLHLGSNQYVLCNEEAANMNAERLTKLWDVPYKVFKGRVTVEMLEV